MQGRTAVADKNNKLDLIDHIHQEHANELQMIAQFYYSASHSTPLAEENIDAVRILDIYHEGILIEIVTAGISTELFVAFVLTGDLEDNILYLAWYAAMKQKKSLLPNQKSYFEVISKQQLSRHFIRLLVQSQHPLPEYYAEYSYGFYLRAMKKAASTQVTGKVKTRGRIGHLFDKGFLWLLKTLSSNKRQHLIKTLNRNVRLYTLRKTFRASPSSPFVDRGIIDIFTHGNSAGSQWADSLKAGDVVMACTELAYQHHYLHQGNIVLIADESAYAALAGILEQWKNTIAPVLIIISTEPSNQQYFSAPLFDETMIADNNKVRRIVCAVTQQAANIIKELNTLNHIDAVWGAMENNVAKQVRHYLRDQRRLNGKQSYLKGYWKSE